MLTFRKDRWLGNGWPSIDIAPARARYFPRFVAHLVAAYGGAPPKIVDTLDGHLADLSILGTEVHMLLDNWTFSLAVPEKAVRDRILADLRTLPPDYFDSPAEGA